MKTIIYNGKLICGDAVIQKGFVCIENGVITEIGSGGPTKKNPIRPAEAGAHWIDAEGNYVSPGFIDLHVHGVGVCDLFKEPVKGLKKMAKILASQGVTSFLPTLITAPLDKIIDSISAIRSHTESIHGANVIGINLEGPFISPEKRGAHPLKDIRVPNVEELKSILDTAGGFLKIITIAPELPGALDLVGLLNANNVIPAIGHTMAGFDDTLTAIERGFNYVTHFFNAMTPFHHRAPGPVTAVLMEKEVRVEIIADGIHIDPAVIKLLCQIKGKEKIVLITDALTGIMRKGDKAGFAGKEAESDGFAIYDSERNLVGSAVPMNRAIKNITKFADLNLTSALKLATINPANVLGIADKKGSIEIGKDADIVIFDEDLNVKTTIVCGKVI